VNADQAAARFENGVLEIRLPKAPEAKGRKIEISKR
jgi:HSP20 family molecular chaperone IbpA